MKVYKTLDQLVLELINTYANTGKANASISSNYAGDVLPFGSDRSVVADENTETITNLIDSINHLVEPRIITGLDVTASNPPDEYINISSGSGVVYGHYVDMPYSTKMKIPLDEKTRVWYVNCDGYQILLESQSYETKLPLAKVVIPKPSITQAIEDDQPDENSNENGWIVSGKDILFDGKWTFDDDSIAMLANKLGYILAKNVYGEINLSENLTIKNTQGTMIADSKSLSFYYDAYTKASEFNRYGVYFYDNSGYELAKFTNSEARVGNILILPNSIQSGNFVAGSSGFQIKDDGDVEFDDAIIRGTIYATAGEIGGWIIGATTLADNSNLDNANIILDKGNSEIRVGNALTSYIKIDGDNRAVYTSDYSSGNLGSGWAITNTGAEFNNVRIRGTISTSVFEKESVSSIGGNFLVADSDILNVDMTALDTSTLTISGDTTFAVNDVLRIKDGANDEWLQVTNASSAPTYTVTRDKAGDYTSNNNPTWKKGTAVVNYGATNEGLVYMTASETNSPYLSVITSTGAPWDFVSTKVRLGNLNGFLGYTSDKYGIAIGESSKYLKYDPDGGLVVKGAITADTGYIGGTNGWTITTNEIVGSTSSIMRAGQTKFATGAGFFLGYDNAASWDTNTGNKFSIGNDTNYMRWNTSALNIKGDLIFDTGRIGGPNGWQVTENTITGNTNSKIMGGATAYATGTGWFMGYSGNAYKLSLGDYTQYLHWDGSTLDVRGALIADSGRIGGTNGWQITTNKIVGNTSSQMMGGQTDYAAGTGWFLGYSTDAYKFSVGNTTKFIKWDGTNLNISGGTIQTSSSGARVEILPDANTGLIIYDDSNNQVFKANVGGVDVGDVILGSATNYVLWDKSAGVLKVANLQSPDYVAGTTGYRLSDTEGLEINTGVGAVFDNSVFSKFGGDGSDGACTISSATDFSTVDGPKAGIAQYTSFTVNTSQTLTVDTDYLIVGVTGDCHIHGTIKADGAVGVTGFQYVGKNASGARGGDSVLLALGGAGGGGASATASYWTDYRNRGRQGGGAGQSGGIGGEISGQSGGDAPATSSYKTNLFESMIDIVDYRTLVFAGSGGEGGHGGGNDDNGGGGGQGGKLVYIEVAGALVFDGVISSDGGNGYSTAAERGSGGGGGGGVILIRANTITTNTGVASGSGGIGGSGGSSIPGGDGYAGYNKITNII